MIKRYLFVAPIKIKKKNGCMINKRQFCAAKLAKSAIMLAVPFSETI